MKWGQAKEESGKAALALTVLLFLIAVSAYVYLTDIRPLVNARDLKPELVNAKVVTVSPLEIELDAKITNPSSDAALPYVDYEVFLEGLYIGNGSIPRMKIPGGSEKELKLRIFVGKIPVNLGDRLSGKSTAAATLRGKAHVKILFFTLPLSLPELPIPLDISMFGENVKGIAALSVLQEHSDETVSSAIKSEDFLNELGEKLGENITPSDAEKLVKGYLDEGAMNMTIEEAIKKYNYSGG